MDEKGGKIELAPFPTEEEEFVNDDRVSVDRLTQTWKLEDERGDEWEWLEKPRKWVPVTDEALVEQQQQAYKMAGVDENAPAVARKRKATDADDNNGNTKKQKPEESQKKSNAIYVTSLPDDVTEDELYQVFSRFGVIAESADTDKPRIKMYYNNNGAFKGDALIVYFRSESVQIAIDMLDEADFRLGQPLPTGPMRIEEADSSFKSQKDRPLKSEQAKTKGSGANRDRDKLIKKNEEMKNRLADWDDDDPSAIPETSSRWDKVVVLKYMFTLKELAEDPAALLDIKEDVREECEKFGKVTNVVLYDKEEEGVVTVRFSSTTAAEASVKVFDGRWFDSRQIIAYIADGKEKFKKSGKDEDHSEDFGTFIDEQ